ncbi:enolase C-terminal domain-like protein [Streptomyces sp. NPDC057381]|uniref:enolase C-terminal domain-like protein n=1 Tax=unclassified Streptomyces TaxID=2593676 RepID=UPI00363AFD0D
MKITRVETFAVPPRWLLCRVETDEGVVGWGEPVVEGRAATVRTAVHELAEPLIGQDPSRIEDHWQVMTKSSFYRGGPVLSSAVAGLDQALWDIAGKRFGVPVHVLLGGPVSLASSLQIAFSTPNLLVQEQSIGIHYNRGAEVLDYVVDPEVFRFPDGCFPRPTGPGLGIEVDERAVRAADNSVPDWRGPVWRHPDGSFAEW